LSDRIVDVAIGDLCMFGVDWELFWRRFGLRSGLQLLITNAIATAIASFFDFKQSKKDRAAITPVIAIAAMMKK
jgi:hypothetical protein